MSHIKTLEIHPYLKRMSLNQEQLQIIQEKKYKDHPELFDYVFALANAFEKLNEVNGKLESIRKAEIEAKIQQGEIMLQIFKLKTQKGFELKKWL